MGGSHGGQRSTRCPKNDGVLKEQFVTAVTSAEAEAWACCSDGKYGSTPRPHGFSVAAEGRNDVSEIHHRFHCHGCNRLCCVRAPALIDFRRGLRVRLLQLAADILVGFLSAHDHRHLDRNARMAARICKPIAALWRAEADQEQYEYACEYASRSGYRVHTFPTTMSLADAKAAAVKEHAAS
jgi:hypothetical protein